MYIGKIISKHKEEYTMETSDFTDAWSFLCDTVNQLKDDVIYAAVLDNNLYRQGHYLCLGKEVAIMRIIK